MKTKIKNILYPIMISILVFCYGCEDADYTQILLDKQVPTNEKDVVALLIGSYNGLRTPLNTEWMMTELRSDNSYQYSVNSTNTTNLEFNDLDMFRPMTTNTQVYQYWGDVFRNIRNANLVLKYLDLVENESDRNQYEGEMRFIRAYHYYNLVQLFGPVPLVTKYISTEEAQKINRSSVSAVYAQIIDDLQTAGNLKGDTYLPKKYTDNSDLGRVTEWSAKTLLAKVYLIQKNYDAARTILLDIKNYSDAHSNEIGLMENYADVFSTINEMSKETIFAIRFKSGPGNEGNPLANRFSPASSGDKYIIGDGNSYNYPSDDLMKNVFEDNDARKAVTIDATNRFVKKYFSQVKRKDDAENDWQVLRYSDVILMLGEVENELSGPSAGLPYLNQIRFRAGLGTLTSTDIPSQSAFRLAMEKERRAEFAFENQRFYDLVRTNRLIPVMNNQFFVTERGWYASYGSGTQGPAFASVPEEKILLPIPQKEIDTSTEFILTQNYGY